ncbi:hypothetical protein [Prosthecobacter sp.]|uniref:hypothetical protein n=1 Tax=Prosthecobacter sp. TaxID=1965333 RepID=UPI0037831644
MTVDEILNEVRSEFSRRKFAAGLAMAFIDFLTSLNALGQGFTSYERFLTAFPREAKTRSGALANTLIVQLPDGTTKSIRPFYNGIEQLIRATHHRLDFPSAAPHATQAWPDYTRWIGGMVSAEVADVIALRDRILAFVLESLPSHELDESAMTKEAPVFLLLLRQFDFCARRGEPTGAAFQGAVFAYLRADAPHLQVEVRKVRTGSKRVGGIGDIDAWDGDRLILSAEAKHLCFRAADVADLEGFANEIARRKAIGLVVADSLEDAARSSLKDKGLIALSRDEMSDVVALWDPMKQRIAAQSYLYYASHVEQNAVLTARVKDFIASVTPQ